MSSNETNTSQAALEQPKFVYPTHDLVRLGNNAYIAVYDGYLFAILIDYELARQYEKFRTKVEREAFLRQNGEKRIKWVRGKKDDKGNR
jgi:hypothetical protein